MPKQLKPCIFTFDSGPPFPGFACSTSSDVVAVTPEVRDRIVAHFAELGDDGTDLMELPVVDGLVSLGWGYTTSIGVA